MVPPRLAVTPTPPLRLTGGSTGSHGRLEIFRNGMWGAVDAASTPNPRALAQVACRQLGYPIAISDSYSTYQDPTLMIQWKGVTCTGIESSVLSCTCDTELSVASSELGVACFPATAAGARVARCVRGMLGVHSF